MGARCGTCGKRVEGDEMFTEVNPKGGYGMDQVLICDECMASSEWASWRARHWANWPELPRQTSDAERRIPKLARL